MKSSGDIPIREAIAADFEDWFRLYDTVAAEGRWIGGEAPSDKVARQRVFDACLRDPDAVTFLAEAAGRLVGNLGVEVRGGIANLGMMVDAPWRGRGVGSALMEACITWATEHGVHKVVLEVWPHNTAAQRLYRKHGFEEEGLFKRHYRRRNGELWDAVRMGLVLDRASPGSPYGLGSSRTWLGSSGMDDSSFEAVWALASEKPDYVEVLRMCHELAVQQNFFTAHDVNDRLSVLGIGNGRFNLRPLLSRGLIYEVEDRPRSRGRISYGMRDIDGIGSALARLDPENP